jgi:hypothetical protein
MQKFAFIKVAKIGKQSDVIALIKYQKYVFIPGPPFYFSNGDFFHYCILFSIFPSMFDQHARVEDLDLITSIKKAARRKGNLFSYIFIGY